METIPSQLYFTIKGIIFDILSECFTTFSWFNMTVAAYSKHLPSFFLIRFCCWFFVFYPISKICILSTTIRIILWNLQQNKWAQLKIKLLPFIEVFGPNLIYRRKWLKKFFFDFIFFILNLHIYETK